MTVTEFSSTRIAPPTADETETYIVFSEGLVGCGNWKRFVLLTDEAQDLPVGVLQCIDEPSVALLVTDPSLVVSDYAAPLTAEDRKDLRLSSDARPVMYTTLTVAKDGTITANLLGPLAVNPLTRCAKQLVLAESSYSARHPVGVVAGQSCSS
jgi:flagellar assembly factor FliW